MQKIYTKNSLQENGSMYDMYNTYFDTKLC